MSDKRSLDDILQQALPEQSKELYLKRWMEFLTFRSNNTKDYTIETVLNESADDKPSEEDYLQY